MKQESFTDLMSVEELESKFSIPAEVWRHWIMTGFLPAITTGIGGKKFQKVRLAVVSEFLRALELNCQSEAISNGSIRRE